MSFVIAAPEMVTTAAQNLAGIRSMLAVSSAAAAAPTTGVVAAAADEVSAGVASLFGAFGQEYQVLSAQASAFHDQFVNLLNAGAGAYLSTEVANAEQAVANAVNAPVQALLGQSSIGTGAAVAAGESAGSAATSAVSGASSAIRAAATSSLTSAGFSGNILAPYGSLVTNTLGNLQGISTAWDYVTTPALLQALTSPAGYPQLILSSLANGNVQPILAIPGHIAQSYANFVGELAVPFSLSITSISPPNATVALGFGLPQLLAFDALGAPYNASIAATASGTAFFNALQTGDPLGALATAVDAPANIANAFLNGEQTLVLTLPLGGLSLTADIPLGGLLVPLQPFTTTVTIPSNPVIQTVTIDGPPVGGLVPALLNYAPELLASTFGG
jgi:PE family protein